MTAFATPTDMLRRYDARLLGDLVSDSGSRVNSAALLSDTNLQAALDDAGGEILSALLMGQRYSESELNALTGNSQNYLKRINCSLAMGFLCERRPWSDDPFRSRMIETADVARRELEDLRLGKRILDTEGAKDAGLAKSVTTPLSIVTPLNLTVDRAREGYYLSRNLPTV